MWIRNTKQQIQRKELEVGNQPQYTQQGNKSLTEMSTSVRDIIVVDDDVNENDVFAVDDGVEEQGCTIEHDVVDTEDEIVNNDPKRINQCEEGDLSSVQKGWFCFLN